MPYRQKAIELLELVVLHNDIDAYKQFKQAKINLEFHDANCVNQFHFVNLLDWLSEQNSLDNCVPEFLLEVAINLCYLKNYPKIKKIIELYENAMQKNPAAAVGLIALYEVKCPEFENFPDKLYKFVIAYLTEEKSSWICLAWALICHFGIGRDKDPEIASISFGNAIHDNNYAAFYFYGIFSNDIAKLEKAGYEGDIALARFHAAQLKFIQHSSSPCNIPPVIFQDYNMAASLGCLRAQEEKIFFLKLQNNDETDLERKGITSSHIDNLQDELAVQGYENPYLQNVLDPSESFFKERINSNQILFLDRIEITENKLNELCVFLEKYTGPIKGLNFYNCIFNFKLSSLSKLNLAILKNKALEKISIYKGFNKASSYVEVKKFLGMLVLNKQITEISLIDCKLMDLKCDSLLKAFSMNKTLKLLSLDNNNLSAEFLIKLVTVISDNTESELRTLDISNQNYKNTSLTLLRINLCEFLKKTNKLEEFAYKSTAYEPEVSNKAFIFFCQELATTKVARFDFSGVNTLTKTGYNALLKLLKKNLHIKYFAFDEGDCDRSLLRKIRQQLAKNNAVDENKSEEQSVVKKAGRIQKLEIFKLADSNQKSSKNQPLIDLAEIVDISRLFDGSYDSKQIPPDFSGPVSVSKKEKKTIQHKQKCNWIQLKLEMESLLDKAESLLEKYFDCNNYSLRLLKIITQIKENYQIVLNQRNEARYSAAEAFIYHSNETLNSIVNSSNYNREKGLSFFSEFYPDLVPQDNEAEKDYINRLFSMK